LIQSYTPGQLVVSSTGSATEHRGCRLGLYEQQDGKHKGAPYYKQRHDTGVPGDIFLYRTGDTWWINDKLGEVKGGMKCPAKGSKTPPDRGWTVSTGEEWIPDGTLRVSTSPYSWCPELTVGIAGAAAERWPGYQGTYHATSKTSCGKKVYRLEGGSKVLLVRPKCTDWAIQDSVEADLANFLSPSAPLCPAARKASTSERFGWTSWMYYTPENDQKWPDGDITLTCPVHT